MNVAEFIAKWRRSERTGRSAAQEHFLDLCEVVGHKKPGEADPAGEWFTFERGATNENGGRGWADVWKRGAFGWEYKGPRKDLDAALRQLQHYRQSLENPPLLVVSDTRRIRIHTNFTNTVHRTYDLALETLGEPENFETLRRLFHGPERLRPVEFHGIELNPYAYDLAQTTLWIGYLQWITADGYGTPALARLLPLNRDRAAK